MVCGSGKRSIAISRDLPQEDAGGRSSALRQAVGCCPDGKDVTGGGGEGQQNDEKVSWLSGAP